MQVTFGSGLFTLHTVFKNELYGLVLTSSICLSYEHVKEKHHNECSGAKPPAPVTPNH